MKNRSSIVLFAVAILLAGATASLAQQGPSLSPVAWLPGDAAAGAAIRDQVAPVIARGADSYLAVWSDSRAVEGTPDIWGVRLDSSGNPIEETSFVIAQDAGSQSAPRVAWNGANWLVTWVSQDPTLYYYQYVLHAARVSPEGVVLDNPSIAITASGDGSSLSHALASDGSNWVVIWQGSSSGNSDIRGARIRYDGILLDPNGVRVKLDGQLVGGVFRISGRTGYGNTPDVSWDGTQWIAVWINPGVYAARIAASGSVIDPGGFPVDVSPGSKASPAIAGGVSGAQLMWHAFANNEYDVYRASVSAAGSADVPSVVGLSARNQLGARPAWNGNGYAATFLSRSADVASVNVQRTDAAGNPLGVEPVTLASGKLSSPHIAWSGQRYLVVWRNDATGWIEAIRLSPGLEPDGAAIQIMVGADPAVAAQGDVFLVVGNDAPINFEYRSPYAVRVQGSTGEVLGPRAVIPTNGAFNFSTDVTALGNRWLVVWEEHATHDNPACTVGMAFVDDGGFPSPPLSAGWAGTYNNAPAVAASADMALVVWQDSRTAANDRGISARRISASGTLLDGAAPILVSAAPNNESAPAVGWDGVQFVALWQDARAATSFFDTQSDQFTPQ